MQIVQRKNVDGDRSTEFSTQKEDLSRRRLNAVFNQAH